MKNEKLINILDAVIIIALGIVVAVCGPSSAIDIWFGVGFLIAGVIFLALSIVALVNTKILPFGFLALGCVLVVLGSCLFTPLLSFAVLAQILVLGLLGLGIAILLHGVYALIATKAVLFGIGEVIVGSLLIVFTSIYLGIPDFYTPFWIIVGILIAVYGVFFLIFAIVDKKSK